MRPNMTRYILGRRNLNVKKLIGRFSEEETSIATELLLELIVDENLPFTVCDNRECFPHALGKLLANLRPG